MNDTAKRGATQILAAVVSGVIAATIASGKTNRQAVEALAPQVQRIDKEQEAMRRELAVTLGGIEKSLIRIEGRLDKAVP